MTQPREDDTDSQQEAQDTSESRPPEHESMSPGPEQADDETATVDEVEDESAGGPVSQAAPQDQDSSSADDAPEDDAGADTEGVADAAASEVPGSAGPDAPSEKRRSGSRSPRRHRRSLGRTLARSVGILTSAALATAIGGVTWWGHAAPTTPTPQLQALSLAQPGGATTYVCPHAPTNTLRGTDVGATESTTAIVPAKGTGTAQSATYAGRSIPTDTATSMNTAEGGILTLVPADGRVANAVGSVTTLTRNGDLRGLTAAPCTQPAAMSWIVGGSIAAGSSSELRLTNPGVTPATAKVTLYGSIGRLSLPSNGEITVPAGGSSSLPLRPRPVPTPPTPRPCASSIPARLRRPCR